MGPAWDYDLAWGNANYCEATEKDGWIYKMWTITARRTSGSRLSGGTN